MVSLTWLLDVSTETQYCPKNDDMVVRNVINWPALDYILAEVEQAIQEKARRRSDGQPYPKYKFDPKNRPNR